MVGTSPPSFAQDQYCNSSKTGEKLPGGHNLAGHFVTTVYNYWGNYLSRSFPCPSSEAIFSDELGPFVH